MATYHVMAVPRPGCSPDPATRPLAPADIAAGSEAEALDQAAADMTVNWEPLGTDMRWTLSARLVNRPAIALRALAELTRGEGGWTYENFSAETFDVLADGVICGRLTRCAGGWFIADAEGALSRLADRIWPDHSGAGLGGTEGWPDGVLADVREALER